MITPWYVGQLLPAWVVTFVDDASKVVNITTATLTAFLRNRSTLAVTSGAGTFVVTDGPNGVATYTPAAADAATAGEYEWRFVATISGKDLKSDWQYWEVKP